MLRDVRHPSVNEVYILYIKCSRILRITAIKVLTVLQYKIKYQHARRALPYGGKKSRGT